MLQMNRITQFGFYSLLTNIDNEILPTKWSVFFIDYQELLTTANQDSV